MISSKLRCTRYLAFRLCRFLCDKTNGKESQVIDSEVGEKEKVKRTASAKLASLLEELTNSQSTVEGKSANRDLVLNLAKPSVTGRVSRRKKKEVEAKDDASEKNEIAEDTHDFKPELVSAVHSVAKTLGGDVQKTKSDLFSRLLLHAQETADSKSGTGVSTSGASKMKEIISGMKLGQDPEQNDTVLTPADKFEPQYAESIDRTAEKPVEESELLQKMRVSTSGATKMKEIISGMKLGQDPEQNDTVPTSADKFEPQYDRTTEKPVEESELLQKMRAHMKGESDNHEMETEKYGSKMSRLFLGVKIDRTRGPKPSIGSNKPLFDRRLNGDVMKNGEADFKETRLSSKRRHPEDDTSGHVDLFGSEPLNWFSVKEDIKSEAAYPDLKTWDALQKHELNLLTSHPQANAYEEMITWTEQGKLWKFPIDNEQGLEEEAKIGFEQHVFLDQHLQGFPDSGPIHQFMELVTVGLSKNPFITVQRKIDHIEWFRQYFKDKEEVLRETNMLLESQSIQ